MHVAKPENRVVNLRGASQSNSHVTLLTAELGLILCLRISAQHQIKPVIIVTITCFSYQEARCVLQKRCSLKAATILPLVGLDRSRQDPINRGHGAQLLHRPPPAGATHNNQKISLPIIFCERMRSSHISAVVVVVLFVVGLVPG